MIIKFDDTSWEGQHAAAYAESSGGGRAGLMGEQNVIRIVKWKSRVLTRCLKKAKRNFYSR